MADVLINAQFMRLNPAMWQKKLTWNAPARSAWLIIARLRAGGVFGRGKKRESGGEASTKCEKCGSELYYPERLAKHMKKAHGNVPAKKMDPRGSDGGMW